MNWLQCPLRVYPAQTNNNANITWRLFIRVRCPVHTIIGFFRVFRFHLRIAFAGPLQQGASVPKLKPITIKCGGNVGRQMGARERWQGGPINCGHRAAGGPALSNNNPPSAVTKAKIFGKFSVGRLIFLPLYCVRNLGARTTTARECRVNMALSSPATTSLQQWHIGVCKSRD